MSRYKVTYSYLDFSNNFHGLRVSGYDEFDADIARDAVEQCREDFYPIHELKIVSVSKYSSSGFYIPVFDAAWL